MVGFVDHRGGALQAHPAPVIFGQIDVGAGLNLEEGDHVAVVVHDHVADPDLGEVLLTDETLVGPRLLLLGGQGDRAGGVAKLFDLGRGDQLRRGFDRRDRLRAGFDDDRFNWLGGLGRGGQALAGAHRVNGGDDRPDRLFQALRGNLDFGVGMAGDHHVEAGAETFPIQFEGLGAVLIQGRLEASVDLLRVGPGKLGGLALLGSGGHRFLDVGRHRQHGFMHVGDGFRQIDSTPVADRIFAVFNDRTLVELSDDLGGDAGIIAGPGLVLGDAPTLATIHRSKDLVVHVGLGLLRHAHDPPLGHFAAADDFDGLALLEGDHDIGLLAWPIADAAVLAEGRHNHAGRNFGRGGKLAFGADRGGVGCRQNCEQGEDEDGRARDQGHGDLRGEE